MNDASAAEQVLPLIQHILSGRTLGGVLGASLKSQEALYGVAYVFYGQAKYAEAARIFAYLITANHLDRRYYSGCAACMHMQGRHADALKHYTLASMLDLTDPEPVMHGAECFLALGDRANARSSLEYALTQARGHDRHQSFVDRLETMLAFLTDVPSPARAEASPTSEEKENVND